jgi:protein arginine kinase activator
MLCEICNKRVATIHLTQIVNNQKVEMYVCDQCAKEKGMYGFEMPFLVGNFFASFLGLNNNSNSSDSSETKLYTPQYQATITCSKCGMSLEEFQKTGRLGCSTCYDTFGEVLKPLIKRLHGSLQHTGKVPVRFSKTVSITREIAKLKDLLNKAIEKEEYEKAAEIRDKIKDLEVNL